MNLKNVILLLFTLILFSCEKESDENSMDFKITGIRDTVMQRGQQFTIPLKVFYLGGAKEQVTVTASGFGNGVSISFDPVNGEPDYNFTQYLNATLTADTGTYNVVITGTSESKKQFSKSFTLRVTEIANSAPVIFLNAGDTVPHRLNDPWFDPGFTATDPEDGNLTAQVQVSGTVNVNQMSNYLLTYQVTDSDGLTTSVTRLVTVINDVVFLNGQYTCTTITPGFPVRIWTTALAASTTLNNQFRIFKISDYFMANPDLMYNPVNDSIYMPAQTFTCITPTDTLPHTFEGSGKVTSHVGTTVAIELYYTDTWTDLGGNLNVQNKRDIYNK